MWLVVLVRCVCVCMCVCVCVCVCVCACVCVCVNFHPQLHVDSDRSMSEAGGAPLKVGVAATPIVARSRAASEMKVTAV